MNKQDSIWKGRYLLIIIASAMLACATGLRSTVLSVFVVPICEDLQISTATLLLYASIASITGLVAAPIWGNLIAKHGLRKIATFSAIVTTVALALWAMARSVVLIYVSAALMGLFGAPSSTLGSSIAITMWFDKKRSSVMGYALTFISVSAVIGCAILPAVITAKGWQTGFWWLTGVFAVMCIPFCLMLKSPAECKMQPFGYEAPAENAEAVNAGEAAPVELPGMTVQEAMRSPIFYILWIGMLLLAFPSSFMSNAAAWGTACGFDASGAGLLISFCTFTGIFGVVLVGIINEKAGVNKTTWIFMILGILGFVLALFAVGRYGIAAAAMVLIAVGYSYQVGLTPIITSIVFGARDYSAIYSRISMSVAVAGIVGAPVIAFLFDKTGSYNGGIIMCAVAWVVAVVLTLISIKKAKQS
ncbi:MAG: MFS transporter [Oscillospiraceae bacterium]|nr:MFS transporter [Oscillospiraceae bacterium]